MFLPRIELKKILFKITTSECDQQSTSNPFYRSNLADRFVRSETDEEEVTWEQRVAKKYYDKLFKEYAICELKYYKEGRIALRWRTEKEVVVGKGQFICASTRCDSTSGLASWEVNFGYMEDGEKKNELVKVRLCAHCSDKLNYKVKKRLAKKRKVETVASNDQNVKKIKLGSGPETSDGKICVYVGRYT